MMHEETVLSLYGEIQSFWQDFGTGWDGIYRRPEDHRTRQDHFAVATIIAGNDRKS